MNQSLNLRPDPQHIPYPRARIVVTQQPRKINPVNSEESGCLPGVALVVAGFPDMGLLAGHPQYLPRTNSATPATIAADSAA
jgi:hypothetical protein